MILLNITYSFIAFANCYVSARENILALQFVCVNLLDLLLFTVYNLALLTFLSHFMCISYAIQLLRKYIFFLLVIDKWF